MKKIPDRLRRTAAALAIVLFAAVSGAAQDADASAEMFKKLSALDLSKQALAREQVLALDLWDSKLLRGIVFGRHGRIFKDRDIRSEERRVGKECRSWWSPSALKTETQAVSSERNR